MRQDAGCKVFRPFPLPSRAIARIVEHPEVLPVVRHATGVIGNREVRVAHTAIAETQRLLVRVIDPACVQLVGDDQLRLRAHEVSALGAVDQAGLEESRRLADDHLSRQRVREEIGHSPGDLRVFLAGEAAELAHGPLVEHHEAVPVPRERGVEELA